VYTPFFERGNTPDTMIMDEKIEGGPKASYYYGEISTRFAVKKSLNSPAWALYTDLTPAVGLSYLKKMNFTHIEKSDYVPATSLGGFTTGMSTLEMASAYATLANDGLYRTPTCIKKIIDIDENVVYESKQKKTRIYKETAARMMTDVLVTAVEEGTGQLAKLSGIPCAGKTGTTNDNKDGWFVGYTRYYTTSVWVGYDLPKTVEGLEGTTYPSYIWKDFMTYAHKGLKPLKFLPYAQLSQEFLDEYYPAEEESEEKEDANNSNDNGVEDEP